MKRLMLIPLLVASLITHAEVVPAKGSADARVRVLNYQGNNVVRLNTFYGVSTHINFGNETIKDVALGDDLGWKIVVRGSNMFIKPTEQFNDTNLTVITDKRTYNFVLLIQGDPKEYKKAWANNDLVYSLTFRYPDDEANRKKSEADLLAKAKENVLNKQTVNNSLKTAVMKKGHNLDYWVRGNSEVSPTSAYDDGTFVYLTFNNNRDIPAIYELDEKNGESLIPNNVVSGNTIQVHRLIQNIIIRRGDYVAQVQNKAFSKDGGVDALSGTISKDVERLVKEAH